MDLVILQEEMGKAVFPSPFFSTVVQCGQLILEGGTEEQKTELLGRIAEGNLIVSLAQYEAETDYTPASIQMEAVPKGGGWVLNGTKQFVQDANIADKLIVAAKTGGEVSLLLVDAKVPGVKVVKLPTVAKDNTCEVVFTDAVAGEMLGAPGAGAALLAKMYAKAAVAKAAEMVGGCKVCIDVSAAYARTREQYGNPIGGYQAIQHFMANMLLAYETSSNYLYMVARMIDDGEDFARDAAALKAHVNESMKYVTEKAVKIHGGIGTTREADVALFFRRVHPFGMMCGSTEHHYEQVANSLLEEGLGAF
jgi:alkylation response protein AidB-like acyl-CoA dehydrogenase